VLYFTADTMDRRHYLVIFYVILLIEPFIVFCHDEETASERRQKRFVAAAIPAIYVGAEVTVALFAALVALYGAEAVRQANVKVENGILFHDFEVKDHLSPYYVTCLHHMGQNSFEISLYFQLQSLPLSTTSMVTQRSILGWVTTREVRALV